ncbi:MAG: hypothetical protein AB7W59_18705 [Acidimicrobiia bacterium]
MPGIATHICCPIEISNIDESLTATLDVALSDPQGKPPSSIICVDDEVVIDVTVTLAGAFARSFCGQLCVGLGLESMGGGAEPDYSQSKDLNPCGDGKYTFQFRIPANTLTTTPCGKVYCASVTLGSRNSCGDAGPIWGFCRELCFAVVECRTN